MAPPSARTGRASRPVPRDPGSEHRVGRHQHQQHRGRGDEVHRQPLAARARLSGEAASADPEAGAEQERGPARETRERHGNGGHDQQRDRRDGSGEPAGRGRQPPAPRAQQGGQQGPPGRCRPGRRGSGRRWRGEKRARYRGRLAAGLPAKIAVVAFTTIPFVLGVLRDDPHAATSAWVCSCRPLSWPGCQKKEGPPPSPPRLPARRGPAAAVTDERLRRPPTKASG